MSFLVTLALAIGVLVAVPIAAHLLRRGRAEEREFPPAGLVPIAPPLARKQSRLEDYGLLTARALAILALAVIGATPLVRCDRLSVARSAGGSVALAIVIDDSLSMRAKQGGATKWQRALDGARELTLSAREGDAVAIVLAGSPARVALAATTDLGSVRKTLDELEISDRATDLEGAVQLGRAALKQLPHRDRRVVLLSDLAGRLPASGEPALWAPLDDLRRPIDDCGVVAAERRGRRVAARIACSSQAAARDRKLQIHAAEGAAPVPRTDAGGAAIARTGDVLGSAALQLRQGEQEVVVDLESDATGLEALLPGTDAIAEDDRAPVLAEASAPGVGVYTDRARSSANTGGPTVIEQALAALERRVAVRPLTLLPEDPGELKPLVALVIDDPAGLPPEARSALSTWLERGGVALALLGPRAATVQLGSTLEPFARGNVRWEPNRARGVTTGSASWLADERSELEELGAKFRAELTGTELAGSEVIARWDDSAPFLVERRVGRGLALSAGVPASPDLSDFALRPGFLALLDDLLDQAAQRSGPRSSPVGTAWSFAPEARVEISGPRGPVELTETGGSSRGRTAVPVLAGAYRVELDGEQQLRVAVLDPAEITEAPRAEGALRALSPGPERSGQVDVSREFGLILLGLLALELVLRAVRSVRSARIARAAS